MTRAHSFAASALCALLAGPLFAQAPAHVTYYGDFVNAYFGEVVFGAGDTNGDGFSDYVNAHTVGQEINSGLVSLYSGRSGQIMRTHLTFGVHPIQVATARDADGDGGSDIVVGNPNFSIVGVTNVGEVIVYSGSSDAIVWRLEGTLYMQSLGRYVSAAGDVNADGLGDLFISNAGVIETRSGLDGSLLSNLTTDYSSFDGSPFVNVGDVNLDGVPDVLVGNPYTTPGQKGAARVFSGSNGQLLYNYAGSVNLEALGIIVSAVGDVDADGRADFVLGGTNGSGVRIHAGSDGSVLTTIQAVSVGHTACASVAAAGDVNGDSVPDVVVGEPYLSPGAPNGQVRLVSGLDGSDLFVHKPAYQQTNGLPSFGKRVDRVGDVDGDGLDEFIVGAFADDSARSYSGSFTVFSTVPAAGSSSFGSGTPSCVGPSTLNVNVTPRVGESKFELEGHGTPDVDVAPFSLLLVTDVADVVGSDPFFLGVTLHVDLFQSTAVYAFDMHNYENLHAAAPVPIPANPFLAGLTLVAQGILYWGPACPALPNALSSTNGLFFTIQP